MEAMSWNSRKFAPAASHAPRLVERWREESSDASSPILITRMDLRRIGEGSRCLNSGGKGGLNSSLDACKALEKCRSLHGGTWKESLVAAHQAHPLGPQPSKAQT